MTREEFLQDLSYWETEYSNFKQVKSWEQVKDNKTENLYFITWVKPWVNKRCWKDDMLWKIYLIIDIDMRKEFEKKNEWETISNEDIIQEWKNMVENLALEDTELWKWRHIVYSWNWLHVYYKLPKLVADAEMYSYWATAFYRKWNEFWWKWAEEYFADDACKNITRIIRLPWSINQWSKTKVEILWSQDKICSYDLNRLWLTEKKRIEKEKEAEIKKRAEDYDKKMQMEKLIQWSNYTNKQTELEELFRKLDNVPIYLVSEKLLPQFKYLDDGRHFESDKPKTWNKFTWFFYNQEMNAIINGWSTHYNFWDASSWYSPSGLVKNHLQLEWKDVIKWFEDNFNINQK